MGSGGAHEKPDGGASRETPRARTAEPLRAVEGDGPEGLRRVASPLRAVEGDGPGRLVRPFAVQIGDEGEKGVAPVPELELTSLVTAARSPEPRDVLRPEWEKILDRARRPHTVVELAAHLELPMSVTRLLASRMVAEGALVLCVPSNEPNEDDLLQAVLTGLRSL